MLHTITAIRKGHDGQLQGAITSNGPSKVNTLIYYFHPPLKITSKVKRTALFADAIQSSIPPSISKLDQFPLRHYVGNGVAAFVFSAVDLRD